MVLSVLNLTLFLTESTRVAPKVDADVFPLLTVDANLLADLQAMCRCEPRVRKSAAGNKRCKCTAHRSTCHHAQTAGDWDSAACLHDEVANKVDEAADHRILQCFIVVS